MNIRKYDFSTKEKTIEAIISECKYQGLNLKSQIAYVLATVNWETANTFKPVKEAYWQSEEWRKDNFRYFPYYGRGFVQITWLKNYKYYGDLLGIDLINNPDLAMNPDIALFILVDGFKNGIFTAKKISDYISDTNTDYINARRCINGTDKAEQIATIATNYLKTI